MAHRRVPILLVIAFLWPCGTYAGWYSGDVTSVAYGYDGATVAFQVTNVTKTSCTCYSPWPTYLCLNAQRNTHKAEIATLLAARMASRKVTVNIDEATCMAVAVEAN